MWKYVSKHFVSTIADLLSFAGHTEEGVQKEV